MLPAAYDSLIVLHETECTMLHKGSQSLHVSSLSVAAFPPACMASKLPSNHLPEHLKAIIRKLRHLRFYRSNTCSQLVTKLKHTVSAETEVENDSLAQTKYMRMVAKACET